MSIPSLKEICFALIHFYNQEEKLDDIFNLGCFHDLKIAYKRFIWMIEKQPLYRKTELDALINEKNDMRIAIEEEEENVMDYEDVQDEIFHKMQNVREGYDNYFSSRKGFHLYCKEKLRISCYDTRSNQLYECNEPASKEDDNGNILMLPNKMILCVNTLGVAMNRTCVSESYLESHIDSKELYVQFLRSVQCKEYVHVYLRSLRNRLYEQLKSHYIDQQKVEQMMMDTKFLCVKIPAKCLWNFHDFVKKTKQIFFFSTKGGPFHIHLYEWVSIQIKLIKVTFPEFDETIRASDCMVWVQYDNKYLSAAMISSVIYKKLLFYSTQIVNRDIYLSI